MKRQVHIIHSFSQNGKGGNPAGVVSNADNLSLQEKQHIATRAGLSETVFISASNRATRKLEFFTPLRQIAYCGHATIAAFAYLRDAGELAELPYSMEGVDRTTQQIRLQEDSVFMEQKLPVFKPASADFAKVLGLEKQDLHRDLPLMTGDSGNGFAYIPLADIRKLKAMQPDMAGIRALSEKFNLVGVYAFVPLEQGMRDAAARMFAPRYGINEEAATGMAAGPLAVYLNQQQQRGKQSYTFAQGVLMQPPSPSKIEVQLEASRIWVGGQAYRAKTLVL